MSPRVTIITATYNWSTVLPYSIGSALGQTFTDFELIVVGDGCTDDSERVVTQIADPRIRWINLPGNTGHQSAPNNEGLRQARGDIIAYLGHDDLWLPHHLASLVRAIDEGAGVAFSIAASVDANGEIIPVVPWPQRGAWGTPSSTAHRASMATVLGGWRDYREIRIPPDVDFWRRAHAAGYRFAFVPRLSVIKFPASARKDVYRQRPSHEQAMWLGRIESEPDLEPLILAKMLAAGGLRHIPFRDLVRRLTSEVLFRLRRRFSPRSQWNGLTWRKRGAGMDAIRQFKGLS